MTKRIDIVILPLVESFYARVESALIAKYLRFLKVLLYRQKLYK